MTSTARCLATVTLWALMATLPAHAGEHFYFPARAQRLVCTSELIVVSRVTGFRGWFSGRRATADAEQIWIGAPRDEFEFRTSYGLLSTPPTGRGDRQLLFLEPDPESEAWSIALRGRARFDFVGEPPSATVTLPSHIVSLPGEEPTGAVRYGELPPARLPLAELRALVDRLRRHHLETVAAAGDELRALLAADRRAEASLRALDAADDGDATTATAALAARDELHALRQLHASRFAERRSWTRDDCDPMPHLDADAAAALFELLRRVDDAGIRLVWCELLEQAALRDELPRVEVARFIDEARAGVGEPQWFGTFYASPGALGGEAASPAAREPRAPPAPSVIAPATLDHRRLEFGLRPWLEVERERAAAEGREALPQPTPAREPAQPEEPDQPDAPLEWRDVQR